MDGILNVEGGYISANFKATRSGYGDVRYISGYGIYNNSAGKVDFKDGNINSECYAGAMTNRSENIYGIYNESSEDLEIVECNININANGVSGKGIYNQYSGKTINIADIEINGDVSGIYNSSGEINISACKISVIGRGIENNGNGTININSGEICSSNSGNSYGIYNNSTGTIKLGTKGDGIVSNKSPYIKAEYTGTSTSYKSYGIYNPKGKLYFYDGRIEGSTLAKTEDTEITEWEENAELLYENDNKALTLTTEAMDIAKIGDITYTSLQEAIDAAGSEKTDIELLRGIDLSNKDMGIIVAEDQNITLDMKGFSIISAVEDAVITNNGKLKITDTTEGAKGKVSTSYSKTIQNNVGAILELEKGTITKNKDGNNIIYNEGTLNVIEAIIAKPDNTYAYSTNSIYNIGNVNITGGNIQAKITNAQNGNLLISNGILNGRISNMNNASIEMRGGTITCTTTNNSTGISNTSTNTVTITGGTIKGAYSYSSEGYGIYSTAGTVNIGKKMTQL